MTDTNRATGEQLPLHRAMILGAVCLAIGLCAGWLIRGWDNAATPASASAGSSSAARQQAPAPAASANTAQLKAEADAQAAPLEEQLKSDPKNANLLIQIGNLYYDAQQYPAAVNYYGQALAVQPSNAAVRTDRGTAYWYMGNADSALKEFDTAIGFESNNPNTLFNRGLVRWQGKRDGSGALSDWKQLLATNPNYEARNKVQQMMAEVTSQTGIR
ncbi:MAG TPA: tetratricopeptide repeat protein [Terracidiphilus sp.]|nr:tetratricopeptide repeat protein [Terracidiphilus sp.]